MVKVPTYSLLVLTLMSTIGTQVLQKKCYTWDSPCLTAKAQSLARFLDDGIPELWTEKLDTMHIDYMHLDRNGYVCDWRDMSLSGLNDAIVDEFSIDMNSRLLRIVFHTDLSLEGNYISNSYLFCMPFIGAGKGLINIYNIQMELIIPFEIVRDCYGRDIIELIGYWYDYDTREHTTFHFGNMYNGCTEQSQIMHALLQENWKYLSITYGRFLYDLVNDKVFSAIRTLMRNMPLGTVPVQNIAYAL